MTTIKYFYMAASLILGSTSICAQQKPVYKNGISVTQHTFRQQGDSLLIDIELDLNNLELSSGRALTLTPVLAGKETGQPLPGILLNGRNRHKVFVRDVSLGKADPDTYYAVIKMTGKQDKTLRYRQSLLYAPWMAKSSLMLNEDLCGCGGHTAESVTEELFAMVPPDPEKEYHVQPMYCYVVPTPEKIKKRTELRDVFLHFPVNKVVIYPDYFDNKAELNRTEEMISKINSDRNLHIRKVVIRGYASPEGSVPSNCRLSEGRAAALKNYLAPRFKGNKLPMTSESGCEDWEGTIRLLAASDIPGRDALLDAIRRGDRSDRAEQALRTIDGGVPYARMLKDIYPKVRRVVCSVDYTVREFTVEEGRELIKTQPELLSLHEMYRVADSYPENSPEFIAAMQTAVRIYPHEETARINAATVALAQGDYDRAKEYLKQTGTSGEAYLNTYGVWLMLTGDCTEAKTYFRKAAEAGSEAASHNLEELAKKCGKTNNSNK